jgi:hypothetical protein
MNFTISLFAHKLGENIMFAVAEIIYNSVARFLRTEVNEVLVLLVGILKHPNILILTNMRTFICWKVVAFIYICTNSILS